MKNSKIGWTDHTWNFISGCVKISAGCKFCYAHTLAERWSGGPAFPNGFDLTIRPHKLHEPLKWTGPVRIFVNSMTDMFWDQIPDEWRDKMLDVIRETPHHHYQLLTKRPYGMTEYFKTRQVPENLWLGVSVEDRKALYRVDILRQMDAKIRWISFEPLLESLGRLDLTGIHWVVTGGESGRHITQDNKKSDRAMVYHGKDWFVMKWALEAVREIRDVCRDQGVAFYHKQWGGPKPDSTGRLLDGVTYDEYPVYL